MGQENFAGPEYFTEFDPEKFFNDLQKQAKNTNSRHDETDSEFSESAGDSTEA